ncbi:MAG: hypothetical protein OXL97_09915 [Chloroflexota bacterium]|nr:hypothetical protein [Chloroflexota bacterium]MDE2885258.1 hypothetical protein [Chloroflexota bacterium]
MTTTPPPAEDVPRYFHDYALENERQHRELATAIAKSEGELKTAIARSRGDLETAIADLRGEIHQIENRLLWRILGGVVVAVGLGTAVDRLLGG